MAGDLLDVGADQAADGELARRAGTGDASAFGELYRRHRSAAVFVARKWTRSPSECEDTVAEAFARVFAAIGRLDERRFRPYLLTTVRNVAKDRLRRQRRPELCQAVPEVISLDAAEDRALSQLEQRLLSDALAGLPARWRTVLWLTEVEGLTPAAAAPELGMSPNAVAALAYRARKRLRQTYLQAHLRQPDADACRPIVGLLSGYVRRAVADPDRHAVDTHLAECGACRRRLIELSEVNATFRTALWPLTSLLARAGEALSALKPTGAGPLAGRAAAGIAVGVLALAGPTAPSPPIRPAAPAPAGAIPAASPAAVPGGDRPQATGPAPAVGPTVAGTVRSFRLDRLPELTAQLTPAATGPAKPGIQPALDAARRVLRTSAATSGIRIPARIPMAAPELNEIIAGAVRAAP
jgi:RNA polymerase sigma factor (sigma-70 family)